MGSGIMPLVEKTVLQCEVARLIGEWRKLDNILYTSQHCFKNSREGTTTPRDWKDRGFHVTQAKPENLFQLSLAVIYLFCLRYQLESTITIVMS